MAGFRVSLPYIMGGIYNVTPPAGTDGQSIPLQVDAAGNLRVTFTGGSASNPAAGPTGSPVPADASYTGVNVGGNLVGVTGFSLTNSVPAAVAIVDGSGNQITSFGGGSQFAMGSAQSSSALGTIALGYDGTNVRGLLTSNTGQLHVIIDAATLGNVNVTQGTSPWVVSLASTTITGNVSVVGATTDGTTAETNFLVVGGESNDATAQYQPIPLGTTGRSVIVEGVAGGTAVPVSGTVAVTQSTSPWVVSLTSTTITGTVAVTQSTSPWVDNITQWASTALGAPQTFGTAPTGIVIGTSSDMYIAGTRARSNQTTTAAGVQDVNLVGALGATMSVTNPLFSSITDGTTKAGVIVATTALKTDLSSVAGTATSVATAGVQLVGIEGRAGTSLETTAGVLDENIKNVGNSAVVTAAAGVQKVGIVGNAAATLDSTIGAATAPTNALATSVVYQTTVPSLTAGQAVAAQCDVAGSHYVNIAGRIPTYSAVNVAPATGTTASTFTAVAGDIAVLSGSASKTIRVTRIEVTLSTSGTAAIGTVQLVKRSTADSAGTSSTMVGVPHDSRFGASTAVALLYTVAPTVGTAVGTIRCVQFNDQSSTVPGSATWIWTFGDGRGGSSGLVLNGTTQQICVNLPVAVATQLAAISFEWTEDNS